MIFRYAGTTKDEQNLGMQIDVRTNAGVGKIFWEKVTGSTRQRPQPEKLREYLWAADIARPANTITLLDHFATSSRFWR